MTDKINLCVTYSPQEGSEMHFSGLSSAYAAYGIFGGKLHRPSLPSFPFSVMCIDGSFFRTEGNDRFLASEIVREAIVRGCRGVLLDISPSREAVSFCSYLAAACRSNGMDFYLPEGIAVSVKHSKVLIRTALCAGSFENRLKDAATMFSPERLALDIGFLRADFTLPSPDGSGRFVDRDELNMLISNYSVFYCDILDANYIIRFTGDDVHFILFDDKRSIERKLDIAAEIGIGTAFIRASDYVEMA